VLALVLLATLPGLPTALQAEEGDVPLFGDPLANPTEERAEHLLPPLPRERSKKEAWLAEKSARLDIHLGDRDLAENVAGPATKSRRRPKATPPNQEAAPLPAGSLIAPVTTLFNLRTREALPLLPGMSVEDRFSPFLRDHYTNQAIRMDDRLVDVLMRVARRFSAPRIEVVSGYRSPKYNLMLRKKGREVARSSQHMEGNAVDFRIRGVPIKRLLGFVRSLRVGGVGYYPQSQFVHSDTGRIRYWRGS
jgi:hypothetical protein